MQATSIQRNGDYVGWVPCLNGQLVFSLVECGLKDSDYNVIEIIHYGKDKNGNLVEYVLVHSTVNWKDFGGKDLIGLWSVVLFSKRPIEEKCHKGMVYFMPKRKDDNKEWDEALNIIYCIDKKLKAEEDLDFIREFSEFEAKINNIQLNNIIYYKSSFNLEEDGIIWLKNDNNKSDNNDKIITRQTYYYIKYTWHRHQHHDSRAETLTTTHDARSACDKEIAEKLIGDLKRNLVRFKRGIDHASHREVLKAKGIVSYAKALVEIMKSREFICEDIYKKELNHLSYFQDSLDIISSGIEKDISMHNQAVSDARALILFAFAIITPALVINRESINNIYKSHEIPGYVKWIGDLYTNEIGFYIFMGVITISLFAYISLQTRYGNTWIFFGCVKKMVAFIVKDRKPNSFLSNSNVLSIVIMLLGSLIVLLSIHGVISALN